MDTGWLGLARRGPALEALYAAAHACCLPFSKEGLVMLTERLIQSDLRDLAAVQAEHEAALLALPNVVGVALGHKQTNGKDSKQRCLAVFVDMKLDRDALGREGAVPATIGSVPTDVREVGILQAGAGPALALRSTEWPETQGWERETHLAEEPTAPQREQLSRARGPAGMPGLGQVPLTAARVRPAVGGLSVGHYHGTAGTLGICCYDNTTGDASANIDSTANGAAWWSAMHHRFYLLSNNHVLANCNEAAIGDPILQPAPVDGGNPATDTIGRLARFVPLRFAQDPGHFPINVVDAAIAEGRFDQLDRRIHWIGDIRHTHATPKIGSRVHTSGRASQYTSGVITAINATINVNYPGGRIARFARQIVCQGLSTGGDSGAVVADLDQRAVGLLFAASPSISVMNPITLVEQLLNVRIAEPATNGTSHGNH
jgi:hypothetical protein